MGYKTFEFKEKKFLDDRPSSKNGRLLHVGQYADGHTGVWTEDEYAGSFLGYLRRNPKLLPDIVYKVRLVVVGGTRKRRRRIPVFKTGIT